MQKFWCDLGFIQKHKINKWFKEHSNHYNAICSQKICDVIMLRNYELLLSFYITYNSENRVIATLEKHNENYIMYKSVIFIL